VSLYAWPLPRDLQPFWSFLTDVVAWLRQTKRDKQLRNADENPGKKNQR